MGAPESERSVFLKDRYLFVGMALGLIIALYNAVELKNVRHSDSGVVAYVNGAPIERERFLTHLNALSTAKSDNLSNRDARNVLERMIEEELIVQRGVELNMLSADGRIRVAIADSVMEMVKSRTEASIPDEKALTAFYDENAGFFTPADRLRIQQVYFVGDEAEIRAHKAFEKLQVGLAAESIITDLSDPPIMQIPDTLLTPTKLREYVGADALKRLQNAQSGFILEPYRQENAWRILIVKERQNNNPPEFETIRTEIETEYIRRKVDEELRNYIGWLKGRAEIIYVDN